MTSRCEFIEPPLALITGRRLVSADLCRAPASDGYDLVVVARRAERLDEVSGSSNRPTAFRFNLSSPICRQSQVGAQ